MPISVNRDFHTESNQSMFVGTVTEAIQWMNCYVVATEHSNDILATTGDQFTPHMGAYRFSAQYFPGTKVVCYRPPHSTVAYIICAVAPEVSLGGSNLPDWVLQSSRTGFKEDRVHSYPLQVNQKLMHLRNFNNGRPCDSFQGDHTVVNALGMGLHLGQLAVLLRGSDLSSIQAFYLDHLIRMNAYNYQLWTAAREEYSGNDEAENNDIVRISPYPWEMLGVKSPGTDASRAGKNGGAWELGNDEAAYEPKEVDQQGVFRLHQFRGYLGDLERIIVSCPAGDQPEIEKLSLPTKYIGLSETVRHIDGRLTMRSANSISIEKYLFIPVPKELKTNDDPEGDVSTGEGANYKSSGKVGDGGEEHKKKQFTWGANKPAIRAAQLWDMHAWLFNSYGLVPFTNHKKDWVVWEEQEAPTDIAGGAVDANVYTPLGQKFSAELPEVLSLKIDNREGNSVKLYRSRSAFAMTDDGSVVLEDGYGSQLILSGGNAYLSAQGDVIMQPGRNFLALAPHDGIIRAGNCAEITAAKNDVRIKAEKNLHILAGNSGTTGGIVIESRATQSTNQFQGVYGTDVKSAGIILVSHKTDVLTYAKNVYTRTLDSGKITLDADTANGEVHVYANNLYECIKTQTMTRFGRKSDDTSDPTGYEIHNGSRIFLGQESALITMAKEVLLPQGGMIARNAIKCDNLSHTTGTSVTKIEEDVLSEPCDRLVEVSNTEKQGTNTVAQATETSTYAEGKVGNEDFYLEVGFTCRTDSQYKISELKLYETRWQQMFRASGGAQTWDEPHVKSPRAGEDTLPWPGRNNWESELCFATVDTTLWDKADLYNAARLYEAPEGTAPESKTLKQGYLINLQ